jgi:hypothetical protein
MILLPVAAEHRRGVISRNIKSRDAASISASR